MDGSPIIHATDLNDQKFIWEIPSEKSPSTRKFAMKTYKHSYYLVFHHGDNIAMLRKGDESDLSKNTNYLIHQV